MKEDGALTWLEYPQRFVAVTVADMERTKEDGLYAPAVAEPQPHRRVSQGRSEMMRELEVARREGARQQRSERVKAYYREWGQHLLALRNRD